MQSQVSPPSRQITQRRLIPIGGRVDETRFYRSAEIASRLRADPLYPNVFVSRKGAVRMSCCHPTRHTHARALYYIEASDTFIIVDSYTSPYLGKFVAVPTATKNTILIERYHGQAHIGVVTELEVYPFPRTDPRKSKVRQ